MLLGTDRMQLSAISGNDAMEPIELTHERVTGEKEATPNSKNLDERILAFVYYLTNKLIIKLTTETKTPTTAIATPVKVINFVVLELMLFSTSVRSSPTAFS